MHPKESAGNMEEMLRQTLKSIEALKAQSASDDSGMQEELIEIESQLMSLLARQKEIRPPYERVKMARRVGRPTTLYYIEQLLDSFVELKGDRLGQDDPAIVGGVGLFQGRPVTVIGHQKGRNTQENIRRNFGMPQPSGYRKAMRLMEQAQKFGRPILLFVDTPGAYCGINAEEKGQAEAIAQCIRKGFTLTVPVLSFVIGEGGSGGALALGVADRVYMLENSVYSIISPEGFASILWKDNTRAVEASSIMKLTSFDLYSGGIVDGILEEPQEGADADPEAVAERIRQTIRRDLKELDLLEPDTRQSLRFHKYRIIGVV